jgi:hypothetical protein
VQKKHELNYKKKEVVPKNRLGRHCKFRNLFRISRKAEGVLKALALRKRAASGVRTHALGRRLAPSTQQIAICCWRFPILGRRARNKPGDLSPGETRKQVVAKRNDAFECPRIPLAAGATEKLAINPGRSRYSVRITCNPPAPRTAGCSSISVPLPAMFVATVIRAGWPAFATISASSASSRALSTTGSRPASEGVRTWLVIGLVTSMTALWRGQVHPRIRERAIAI